jgi:hypothetical protein
MSISNAYIQSGSAMQRYALLVVNTTAGITGTVSVEAFAEEDAVRDFERLNPFCVVICVSGTED